MANIKLTEVKKEEFTNYGAPIKLNNGSLVIHREKKGGMVLATYIVTSFRASNQSNLDRGISNYCSFVELSNGYIAFTEPSSRNTTMRRVLNHLRQGEYGGKNAELNGEFIEVIPTNMYNLNIEYTPQGDK